MTTKATLKAFLNPHQLGAYLQQQGLNTDILGFSIHIFAASWKTSTFWALIDPNRNVAIAVQMVGVTTSYLTVIVSPECKSIDYWHEMVSTHPILRRNSFITFFFQAKLTSISKPLLSQASFNISSTQFILSTAPIPYSAFSSNIKRNISKADRLCTVIELPVHEAIPKYIEMVDFSDIRRSQSGINNSKHNHSELKDVLTFSTSKLYFAKCGDTIAAAVQICIIHDRAYYMMGGTSPEGMKIGAAPFLLANVAELLAQHDIRSLTLGLANRETLKQFKKGLGALDTEILMVDFTLKKSILTAIWIPMLKGFLLLNRWLSRPQRHPAQEQS